MIVADCIDSFKFTVAIDLCYSSLARSVKLGKHSNPCKYMYIYFIGVPIAEIINKYNERKQQGNGEVRAWVQWATAKEDSVRCRVPETVRQCGPKTVTGRPNSRYRADTDVNKKAHTHNIKLF